MNPVYGRKSDLQDELEAHGAHAFFRPYSFADLKQSHGFSTFPQQFTKRKKQRERLLLLLIFLLNWVPQ
jgi:hypothetical protein